MAEKIKYGDLAQKGLLNPLVKEIEAVDKVLVEQQKTLKETISLLTEFSGSIKIDKKTVQNITDVEKAFDGIISAEQELIEIEKQRLKLQTQLSKARNIQSDEVAKLRIQVQEENKAAKQRAKESLGLVDAYERESKRLIVLRKEQKSLAIQQRLGVKLNKQQEKSLKDLTKEIEELDEALKDVDASAGQFQREVGNYPKTAGKAKAGFQTLSAFIIGIFVSNFEKARDTAREFTIFLEQAGSTARTVTVGIVNFFTNVIAPSFDNLILRFQKGSIEAKLFFKELVPEALRDGKASKSINDLAKELDLLNKQIEKNNDAIKGAESFADIFDKSSKAIKENIKDIRELLIAEAVLSDQRQLLTVRIEALNKQQEIQQALADDTTRSFAEQQKELAKTLVIQEKRLNLENILAEKELALAIKRININFKEQGLNDRINRQNVERLDFLKDFDKADKLQAENVEILVQSIKTLQAVEADRILARIQNARQEREINRDLFEQNLDFAIDVFDRQKSVNERLIASDKTILSEKVKIFNETEKLLETSFDNQIQLTEDFIAQSLRSIGKTEEEVALAIEQINIRKLTELKDEAEVRKQLIDSGFVDEITQNRIREIILERKTFVQDLADLQNDINDKAQEDETALLTQRREINATIKEEEFQDAEESFVNSKNFDRKKLDSALAALEIEKEAIFSVIELEEDLALKLAITDSERTRAVEDANEKRRQIERETIEQRLELEKKANEKIREENLKTFKLIEQGIKILTAINEKRNEEQLAELDSEVEAAEDKQTELEGLAQQGLVEQKQNLALAKSERAEAELERKKELEQQKREAAGLALINLISAKAAAGDQNAFVNAVTEFLAAKEFIDALPAFYEGTDEVEKSLGKPHLPGKSKDKYVIRADGKEQIWSGKDRADVGFKNRAEIKQLVHIAEAVQSNELTPDILIPNGSYQTNEQMIQGFDKLNKTMAKGFNNMPAVEFGWSQIEQRFFKKVKRGNDIKITYE